MSGMIRSGTPCLMDTRMPIKDLFECFQDQT